MTSTTVQFAVAGALLAAWAWMLGRPLVANLLRRSRRDSISHFRYQQAVLGSHDGRLPGRRWSWEDRPAPIATWRAQPLDSKRLQLLMASAISAFVALLLAIALRGLFVRLLLLMTVLFVAHLGFAAYVGSVRLREFEAQARLRRAERERILIDELAALDRAETAIADGSTDLVVGSQAEPDRYGPVFGPTDVDVPEVRFPPLEIDPAGPSAPIEPAAASTQEQIDPLPAASDDVLAASASVETPTAEPTRQPAEPPPEPAEPTRQPAERFEEPAEPIEEPVEPMVSEQDDRIGGAFKPAPDSRRRAARPPKARPIYIESQMDEPEGDQKAVND